jgi:hypothetical protein
MQMPTDYLLFIHGVNTRKEGLQPNYADGLFDLIQYYSNHAPAQTLKKIALYWGDVGKDKEQALLNAYQNSSIWDELWFKQFRENQIMRFVGDGALYISRCCGSKVANALEQQILAGLDGFDPETDRLHIVTHSMGTVILFDILFSARWDSNDAQGHGSVATIRNVFFGLSPNPTQGLRLGSISTMGSPIGFFSLIDIDKPTYDSHGNTTCTHDITPHLEKFLDSLQRELGKKLPWYNFVHPGDPIAYPLEKLLPQLVDATSQFIDLQDILTHATSLIDLLIDPWSQTTFALLHGGEAHGSYWQSDQVAQQIAQAIACAL